MKSTPRALLFYKIVRMLFFFSGFHFVTTSGNQLTLILFLSLLCVQTHCSVRKVSSRPTNVCLFHFSALLYFLFVSAVDTNPSSRSSLPSEPLLVKGILEGIG
jgi:hypothetical protein